MNWEAIGAIGEVLGALGVIATLVFLAFQIKQNSRLLQTNNDQLEQNHRLAIADALGQLNEQQQTMIAIAQDGELSRIFFEGLRDYEGLPPEMRMRFALIMGPLMGSVVSQTERHIELGLNDGNISSEQLAFIYDFVSMPGGREWWARYSNRYPERFRIVLNRELERET